MTGQPDWISASSMMERHPSRPTGITGVGQAGSRARTSRSRCKSVLRWCATGSGVVVMEQMTAAGLPLRRSAAKSDHDLVGKARFELATSRSRTVHSNLAELLPEGAR